MHRPDITKKHFHTRYIPACKCSSSVWVNARMTYFGHKIMTYTFKSLYKHTHIHTYTHTHMHVVGRGQQNLVYIRASCPTAAARAKVRTHIGHTSMHLCSTRSLNTSRLCQNVAFIWWNLFSLHWCLNSYSTGIHKHVQYIYTWTSAWEFPVKRIPSIDLCMQSCDFPRKHVPNRKY
jgi:hypothetical protein